MDEAILVINAGSFSVKFALYRHPSLQLIYQGEIENILEKPQWHVVDAKKKPLIHQSLAIRGYEQGIHHLLGWLENKAAAFKLCAVGHRVVHGGLIFHGPCLVSAEEIQQLKQLSALAPLHQPYAILAIEIIRQRSPQLVQIACFDTSFHASQPSLSRQFAIPKALSDEGIVRYVFHGISYEYIASQLPQLLKEKAKGKVIMAHLGQGASLCALENGKSVATSMGFTALDGLMMGTRCGSIDPGVILYLLQEKKFSVEQVQHVLYHQSGLLGVSGISSDMRVLEFSDDKRAEEAIALFCYRAVREIGSLCAHLQGCDAIIFTGGIGEHSARVRKAVLEKLDWLGVVIDDRANAHHLSLIHHKTSAVWVGVVATDEGLLIGKHTQNLLNKANLSL